MKFIPWDNIISSFRRKNSFSSPDEKELEEWISDDANRGFYEEMRTLWESVQERAMAYTPDKNAGWKKVQSRIRQKRQSISIATHRMYRIGIAASVILVIGLSYLLFTGHDDVQQIQYSALNGKSKIDLPDGSVLWIGSRSTCTYASDFSAENRQIEIRGKAFFNVKKDPEHPFTVKVGNAEITVLGTSFNISETDDDLSVSLLTGSILFQTGTQDKIRIEPGQCVNLNKQTGKCIVFSTDVTFDALWAQDVLKIENKSLGEVVKYLNQWYGVNINLDKSLQDKFQYTFSVNNEQLDEILRMMSRINPMEITYDKNDITIK